MRLDTITQAEVSNLRRSEPQVPPALATELTPYLEKGYQIQRQEDGIHIKHPTNSKFYTPAKLSSGICDRCALAGGTCAQTKTLYTLLQSEPTAPAYFMHHQGS